MKILKTSLLLLLTAALLLGLACLPRVVEYVSDGIRQNRVGAHSVPSVQLVLERHQRSTMAEKMYLINQGEAINANPADLMMTEQEVTAAVEAALAQYFDAGLLRGWKQDGYRMDCRPVLAYDPASGLYDYSWVVMLQLHDDEPPMGQLNLSIDDETGKMTGIYFSMPEPVFDPEEIPSLLETMTMIFLEELELPPSEVIRELNTKGELSSVCYAFDVQAGRLGLRFTLEFCMYPGGFYLQ